MDLAEKKDLTSDCKAGSVGEQAHSDWIAEAYESGQPKSVG